MRPGGGARFSGPAGADPFAGWVPVVTLVPRCTTEKVAEVLVVAGAFRASRL